MFYSISPLYESLTTYAHGSCYFWSIKKPYKKIPYKPYFQLVTIPLTTRLYVRTHM